jgi:hypothetical protein
MKKHNRKRKTHHLKLAHIGGIILGALIILPWSLPVFFDLTAEQVGTQVKRLEHEKRSLEASLRRQTSDWNHLIEPKRLDEAVRQNGMSLSYPSSDRQVVVRKDGRLEIPAALHASLQQERIAKSEISKPSKVASATPTARQRTTRRRR